MGERHRNTFSSDFNGFRPEQRGHRAKFTWLAAQEPGGDSEEPEPEDWKNTAPRWPNARPGRKQETHGILVKFPAIFEATGSPGSRQPPRGLSRGGPEFPAPGPRAESGGRGRIRFRR